MNDKAKKNLIASAVGDRLVLLTNGDNLVFLQRRELDLVTAVARSTDQFEVSPEMNAIR